MRNIHYIDRVTRKEEKEEVYGKFFLEILYGEKWYERLISLLLLPLSTRLSFVSKLYGYLQKKPSSKKKILPFIKKFKIEVADFLDPPESYASFNDFFIRKLKPESRPFANGNDVAILPADGRYLVYQNIADADGFLVKGKKFSLDRLLHDIDLADTYGKGSMVIARLCPVDYHRFHFVCNCIPGEPKFINGPLYSVNPLALKRHIEILTENKRVITPLQSKNFGTVQYIEVGATHVGSIHQTFIPKEPYAKGDEKGYFSFGGSCLILLFEPGRIQFDQDLIDATLRKIEIRGKLGQSLGRALPLF